MHPIISSTAALAAVHFLRMAFRKVIDNHRLIMYNRGR